MLAIAAIIALFVALLLSLIITRVATVALTLTGMSEEAARFQARSALSGVGFTTQEAEGAVNHPVRRRIVMTLMILHSAGLATIVVSLILAFSEADSVAGPPVWQRLIYIVLGVLVLWLLARSSVFDRWLRRLITRALSRWTDVDARDYAALLRLSGDYAIVESQVQPGDWIAGKALQECNLLAEGIIVLGIRRRDGTYLGSPRGTTSIEAGDTLLLYGRREPLADLDRREAGWPGEAAHRQMVQAEAELRRLQEAANAQDPPSADEDPENP